MSGLPEDQHECGSVISCIDLTVQQLFPYWVIVHLHADEPPYPKVTGTAKNIE